MPIRQKNVSSLPVTTAVTSGGFIRTGGFWNGMEERTCSAKRFR